MQFGIFSVGDVTLDPTTGRMPSEVQRIQAMVAIALRRAGCGVPMTTGPGGLERDRGRRGARG